MTLRGQGRLASCLLAGSEPVMVLKTAMGIRLELYQICCWLPRHSAQKPSLLTGLRSSSCQPLTSLTGSPSCCSCRACLSTLASDHGCIEEAGRLVCPPKQDSGPQPKSSTAPRHHTWWANLDAGWCRWRGERMCEWGWGPTGVRCRPRGPQCRSSQSSVSMGLVPAMVPLHRTLLKTQPSHPEGGGW